MSDIGGVWRTVGGRRIFIKDGDDLVTAMKSSGKFGNKKNNTSDIKEKINDFFKDKDLTKEHLIMFNDKGDILQTIEGKDDSNVGDLKTLTKMITNKKDTLLIAHNHPNNTSFSYKDIRAFNSFKSVNSIVVVTNDKFYTLSKNNVNKIKSSTFKKDYYKIRENLEKQNGKKNKNLDLANKEIADKIGWRYEVYDR